MIKNENGRVINLILNLFLKLLITIALVVIVAFITLKVLGVELKVSYENGKLSLQKQKEFKVQVIDDEYPNIADYQEDSYFYNQLDDNAKAIYLGIQDNLENMKSGNYRIDFGTRFNTLLQTKEGQESLSISYQDAVDALKQDTPGLFYIDFSKVYLNTYSLTEGNTTTHTVFIDQGDNQNYFAKGFNTKSDVVRAVAQVEEVRNLVVSAIPEGSSNFEKILYVHDWLVDNLSYDETLSKDNRSNVFGALVEKSVTCQGYAKAFKYIIDSLSVPCILVKGDATNSQGTTEKHVWNYVQINDGWYAVDVTWDDPIIIGSGELSPEIKYTYFCKGKSFLDNHVEEGTLPGSEEYFKYPELVSD